MQVVLLPPAGPAPMAEDINAEIPSRLLLAFAPLHKSALGIACGLVLSLLIFLMTGILLLRGGENVGMTLGLLGHFFIGYTVTWPGAFIGLAWGFGAGFVLGWGVALVRNAVIWVWLTSIRSQAEMDQYGDFLDHL